MKWELLCPGLGEENKILVVRWSPGLWLDIDNVVSKDNLLVVEWHWRFPLENHSL
jgi:hypothetical protein